MPKAIPGSEERCLQVSHCGKGRERDCAGHLNRFEPEDSTVFMLKSRASFPPLPSSSLWCAEQYWPLACPQSKPEYKQTLCIERQENQNETRSSSKEPTTQNTKKAQFWDTLRILCKQQSWQRLISAFGSHQKPLKILLSLWGSDFTPETYLPCTHTEALSFSLNLERIL